MKVNLRTRLIMDAIIAMTGLVILYIWDWPIEAIGVIAVTWTLIDCSSMLLSLKGVKM